jgi:hypothetical protein
MKAFFITLLVIIRLSALALTGPPRPDCQTLTFEAVSADVWNCVKAKFKVNGFAVADGTSGEISKGAIRGNFEFQPVQEKLTITIVTDGVCATVSRAVNEAIDGCRDFEQVHLLERTPTAERWRIVAPNIKQEETRYIQIKIRRGDTVTMSAGGCVQHGGPGKTWSLYVDPQKETNNGNFYGQVRLPGMYTLQRIKDVMTSSYRVPNDAVGDMFLKLGFSDFRHTDNGYWGRKGDDGFNDQCKGFPNAWVEISIVH